MACNHISEDDPRLLIEITEYRNHFEQYTQELDSLQCIIDCIVKSKFIKCGIWPTTSDNYQNIGYYHFGDVANLLELVWDNYIYYMDEVKSFNTKNSIVIQTYNTQGDVLKLGNWVLGNGMKNRGGKHARSPEWPSKRLRFT